MEMILYKNEIFQIPELPAAPPQFYTLLYIISFSFLFLWVFASLKHDAASQREFCSHCDVLRLLFPQYSTLY